MGIEVYSHEAKAKILWTVFKDRMGKTEFTQMYFDLGQLLQPGENLERLEILFAKKLKELYLTYPITNPQGLMVLVMNS